MQPAIFSLIIAATAHLASASPLSRLQGVARKSGAGSIVGYGATQASPRQARAVGDVSATTVDKDQSTGVTAGEAQELAGQENRQGKGKRNPANGGNTGAIPLELIPSFGIEQGNGKDGIQKGSCAGFANGKFVAIQCNCPPDRDDFITQLNQFVAAGKRNDVEIKFSKDVNDKSVQTMKDRATAMVVVMQSFFSKPGEKGVGCPSPSYPNIASQQVTGKEDTTPDTDPSRKFTAA